jgi:hypothetical protein
MSIDDVPSPGGPSAKIEISQNQWNRLDLTGLVGTITYRATCWTFLLLFALVLLAARTVWAEQVMVEDDFTGNDGDPPDPLVWEVIKQDDNDAVEILDDQLLTLTYSMGHSRAELKDYVITNELTILVDYYVTNQQGRPFDIIVSTWLDDRIKGMVSFCYDTGYGWHIYYRTDSNVTLYVSYTRNLRSNTWYTMNVTIDGADCQISVTEKATSDVTFSWSTNLLDPLQSENYVRFGCFAPDPGLSPRALWDNFRLINLGDDVRRPPRWGDLPVFYAVEDVPFSFNFSGNVTDPDTPLRWLGIESDSPYFRGCDNLTCTFLFPNGVTEAEVNLTLTDRFNRVNTTARFIIQPVNDPPECWVPTEHVVMEDVGYSIVFTPYVSDIDNEMADLYLEVDSPYASAEGLLLSVLYLDSITEDNLTVRVCDGVDWTEVVLHFTVRPVDDPPTIADLGEVTVLEDVAAEFDVGPYIGDIDTPFDQLVVTVDDVANCTVDGTTLSLLFRTGGITKVVMVSVTDGRSVTSGSLIVHVQEMNDPPVVDEIPIQYFSEDQAKVVDLAPFIHDEDTPLADLTLECGHHAVTAIEGLTISFTYDEWEPNHTVEFQVFDRIAKTTGEFGVVVRDVNQPPVIQGIGDYDPPVVIKVMEGVKLYLKVRVFDEDSSVFEYGLTSEWSGLVMHPNGTLEVITIGETVAEHLGVVTVDDLAGGTDSLEFTVRVLPRNRPPEYPEILMPQNGSVFEEGENIEFRVSVTDPDLPYGDVLTIVWTSNVSGELRRCQLDDGPSFNTTDLNVGVHRIQVIVSDGEFDRASWVEITVKESGSPNGGPGPGPDGPGGDDGGDGPQDPVDLTLSGGILLLIVVIVIALILAYMYVWRRRPPQD